MYDKILVTGGCGFIGSNFLHYLNDNGHRGKIVVVDKLTYAGDTKNMPHHKCKLNYDFYKGDICDRNLMKHIISNEKPDAVINFAAESHVDRSIEGSAEFIQSNVVGVETLLSVLNEECPKARFLQVSTDEVYGSLQPETPASCEGDMLLPRSPYSASKAAADLLVQSYHHTHGMDTIITRCSNNYGPRQFPEKLIPLMIDRALSEERLPVYGDGANIRDWIHVDDHCDGIWKALNVGISGHTYNFGGNNQTRNIDLVKMILSQLGKSEELIEFVEDRKGHDFRYDIDCMKANMKLGWRARVGFKEGIAATIEWYTRNIQKS